MGVTNPAAPATGNHAPSLAARRFAPLRGALVLPVDEEEEGAAAAHAGSAIEVLFEDPAWRVRGEEERGGEV